MLQVVIDQTKTPAIPQEGTAGVHHGGLHTRGSIGVAAFVGFWAFWFLLAFGVFVGELSPKQVIVFLLLWIAGRLGLAHLPSPFPALFSPYVAALDIALVFVVFKGDVPLS